MYEILKSFGPWALVFTAMAWLLKVMVSDKLKSIQETLKDLVEGQANHSDRIVKIETVMKINGCMDPSGPFGCANTRKK